MTTKDFVARLEEPLRLLREAHGHLEALTKDGFLEEDVDTKVWGTAATMRDQAQHLIERLESL